jgi:L-ascorbate metabolism protein UlaG (beta-lactamase superfamily)
MILRYYGHSLFTLTLENGLVILTDPYGDFCNYPRARLGANVVTISHHHFDHDSVAMVVGNPTVIDGAGVHAPAAGLVITGVPSKHDERGGARRGDNLIFVIEAEGLKIVHMGDIGHTVDDRQRNAIGTPDVLMLPVGGTFTTDAAAAAENVRLLRPRVAIPMHYRTRYNTEMNIQTEKPFLELMKAAPTPIPLCRITKGDIGERPPVILMDIQAGTTS